MRSVIRYLGEKEKGVVVGTRVCATFTRWVVLVTVTARRPSMECERETAAMQEDKLVG